LWRISRGCGPTERIAGIGYLGNYVLAPDGKRVAALMPTGTPAEAEGSEPRDLLENFFEELRRRTATQAK